MAALGQGLALQLNTIYANCTGAKARTKTFGKKQPELDASDTAIQSLLRENIMWRKDSVRNDLRSYDNIPVSHNDIEQEQYKLLNNGTASVASMFTAGEQRLQSFIPSLIHGLSQTFPRRVPMTID